MKRRKLARADSLDLLLSTMTSSFAGIILIAILMALTSREANKATDKSRIAEANNAILARKIEQAKTGIAAATDLHGSLQTTLSGSGIATITALMADKDRMKQRLDDALEKNAALGAAVKSPRDVKDPGEILRALKNGLAGLKKQMEKETARQTSLAEQIDTLNGRLTDLGGEIDRDYNAHVRKLRLPKERENPKQTYSFIVRYNKVYPLSDIDGGLNNKSLVWVKQPDGISSEVRPIEGAGLDMQADRKTILDILRRVPKDEFFAACYVYGDSFKTFSDLKELIIEAGLEYGWQPETPLQKLIFSEKGVSPPTL